MHNWGAGKARLMSGLSARLQLLDLACHTHSNQPCKNYRLHWFLVFICECLWVRVLGAACEHTILPKPSKKCVCVWYECACCAQLCSNMHVLWEQGLNQVCTHLALQNLCALIVAVGSCKGTHRTHYHQIWPPYCDNRQHTLIFNSALCSNLKSVFCFFFKRIHLHARVHVRVATQSLNVHAWKVQCGWSAMAALVSVM